MTRVSAPTADYVMLAALLGAVGLMGCFAVGFFWSMQPTVIPNAGMAGYESQMRRSNAVMTATLTREHERLSVQPAEAENKRQGLEKLSNQAITAERPADPLPKPRRIVHAPKREAREVYAARPVPSTAVSPFAAFQRLFR